MKRDPITTLLAGSLLMSVILTAGLCYWYLQCTRQFGQVQAEVAAIDQNRGIIQSLASEAVDYSRKNPSILPVLESLGIRPRGTGTPGK